MNLLSSPFKVFIFISALVISSVSHAQDTEIKIGKKERIQSKTLNEERVLWIHTPPNMDPNGKYPVVYLLDGSGHFASVCSMIDYLANSALCPPMIVVGIQNTDRSRDLTPTPVDPNHPYAANDRFANTGGGDMFFRFMEGELFPYIESNYPAAPYRVYIGHSLGGLTTMNALVHHTAAFNAFVSIDPSMWWSKQSLLSEITSEKNKGKFKGKTMYLGIANTMKPGTTIEQAKADTSFDSEHMRAIIATDEYFKSHPETGLKYASKYYGNDDHGSVPFITEYDAFRFIFDFYRMEVSGPDEKDLLNKSISHYETVSKEMGYEVLPDEWMVNGLGYRYMGEENYEMAEKAFLLNVKNFPKSGNVYDSLGDYYTEVGNAEKAIESFEKALSIEEAEHTRSKLNLLKQEGIKK